MINQQVTRGKRLPVRVHLDQSAERLIVQLLRYHIVAALYPVRVVAIR